MYKLSLFMILSLLLVGAVSLQSDQIKDTPDCPLKADYTFNLLTIFWPPGFCSRKQGQCYENWRDGWSGTLGTIHGYWPSSAEASYLHCFGYEGDKNCLGLMYDKEIIANETELLKDMAIYWPEISELTTDGYYDHEWNKHGNCYLMNFMENNPKAYENDPWAFNRTMFVSYFQDTIEKTKKLNINLKSGTWYKNKHQLAADIKIKHTQFRAKCYGDDTLNEILVCYSRSEKPGQEVLIDCPPQLPFYPDDEIEIDCYEKPFYIV